ncbi:MAG: nicotinate-nucleotide adenylyltransferase [Xanthomonadaceae bacterium]|jgi:nicotinate-nucleotide adenylyltransferase|nr:nicotinate-nucleotide adenylyltransferase [Xanthomonadaceae bacterium]
MSPAAARKLRTHYGGTFDPVHVGHLAIARAARDELDAPVHLMPAADPPHRSAPGANARQRVAMLELAIDGEAGLTIDQRELSRAGPSYSVETLRELRREYGSGTALALLLGADSFLSLPTWYHWRELLQLAHLIVADRPGSSLDDGLSADLTEAVEGRWRAEPEALTAAPAGYVFRLRQPLQLESATGIRDAIAADSASWRQWVPATVADYIVAHGLYGAASSTPSSGAGGDISR